MAATRSDEFKRDAARIALTSGLTRRQVASDLGIGLSTLGKWVRAVSEEASVPAQDNELLRENERVVSRMWWKLPSSGLRACNDGSSQAARSRDIGSSG